MQMKASEYITHRLDEQQKWYSDKSTLNKNYYNRFKISTIILAVMIPLISGLDEFAVINVSTNIITGSLGAVVAILSSVSGLLKFKDKWINYRMASEQLKSEKYLWASQTAPYNRPEAYNILVSRVEAIIRAENGDWGGYIGVEGGRAESGV